MTAKVLELENILEPDRLACEISRTWIEWDTGRQVWKNAVEEITRYLYATDTTQTTNAQLPWKNKTTVPKMTQIMDNLYANYTATLFPQRRWLIWEANEKNSDSVFKRDSIVNYMTWVVSQPSFKVNIYKALHDYIQKGNTFLMPEWVDERVLIDEEGRTQAGYVGPAARRINPLDTVMNPAADEYRHSPKIIKSILSMGEVKDMLDSMSTEDNREDLMQLWDYMKNIRGQATSFEGEWQQNDAIYQMAGFTSYRDYLRSNYVEVLTFYGDLYDAESDTFLKNHIITVIDRHKIITKKPNPSYFGYPPIFHTAWRKRPDNLWGMGPLDNLVGMQYRLDHLENMKADIMDLVTYPVQKVKGFVEDFTWQPGEKIFVGEEGDVELVVPDVNALQANLELQNLERLMEEMAGSPKEAMGFRTPGEKTKYEVQRQENAASRLFQNKIRQFEEEVLEPLLNAMLELARRNMVGATTIKVFDDEFKVASFQTLTVEDITGVGRIKCVAARHFSEQAELIQNLTNLTNSGLWPTVQPHFSSIRLAQIVEDAFNLTNYEVVLPFIALSEQADAQKQMQSLEEQTAMQTMTASGIGEDFDMDQLPPEIGQ
jgi:hypothetical protein